MAEHLSTPNSPNADDDRFKELVTRHLEGVLSAAELAELDALLAGDPERTEYFFNRQVLAHTLAECSEAWLQETPAPSAGNPPEKAENLPVLSLGYWRRHRMQFGGLALALTLLLWVGVGYVILQGMKGGPPGPASTPTGVATITNLRGAEWAEGGTVYKLQDPLEASETLELTEGFVEVTFAHGAVVLLEAPSKFTIDTRGAGTLEYGQLVARLENQAEKAAVSPFAIYTPLAEVIDRGTEFGVGVTDDSTTEVTVFQGLVEAKPLNSDSRRPPQPLRISAGQSAQIRPGQQAFEPSQISSGQFVQEIPTRNTEIITPVAAETSLAGSLPDLCIDGSGLNASGTINQWKHAYLPELPGSSWATGLRHLPASLTFDLGGHYDLSTMWIWNYSHPNDIYRERCTKSLRVEISSDGRTFTDLGNLELAQFKTDPTRGQRFTFNHQARYVRLVVLDGHARPENPDRQSSEIGLGEVRFEGIPVQP